MQIAHHKFVTLKFVHLLRFWQHDCMVRNIYSPEHFLKNFLVGALEAQRSPNRTNYFLAWFGL